MMASRSHPEYMVERSAKKYFFSGLRWPSWDHVSGTWLRNSGMSFTCYHMLGTENSDHYGTFMVVTWKFQKTCFSPARIWCMKPIGQFYSSGRKTFYNKVITCRDLFTYCFVYHEIIQGFLGIELLAKLHHGLLVCFKVLTVLRGGVPLGLIPHGRMYND